MATAIIVFRSLAYLFFEQLAFNSDQAIVGLMAKHLSEGRAFPLFFYGQTYMLGVESWAAAPVFLVAGPTVRALRLSLLAWNVAFGLLLVVALRRDAGLRVWAPIVPALFFLAAPASVTSRLIDAQGGIIEPFVYVAVLWFLRSRPIWFGVVLAIGFRNREFTLYAVPAMLVVELLSGGMHRQRLRDWLIAMVAFFAVWEVIEALKPLADLEGPGTRGQLIGGFTGSQLANLVDRFGWEPAGVGGRFETMGRDLMGWFAGGIQIDSALPLPARTWLGWAAGVFVLAISVRLALLLTFSDDDGRMGWPRAHALQAQVSRAPFAFYLLGIGLESILVFMVGRPSLVGFSRYVILGLLVPVGLSAALLALERQTWIRRLVTIVIVGWAVLSVADHARVLASFVKTPPMNPARQVADYLVAEGVPVARAGYWRAYAVTFFARERVRVASSDFIRIREYQDAFDDQSQSGLVIAEVPCPGAKEVAGWYLCKPQ